MAIRSAGEIDFVINGDTSAFALKLRRDLEMAMAGVRKGQDLAIFQRGLTSEMKNTLSAANSLNVGIGGMKGNLASIPVGVVQGLTVALTAATTAALGLGTAIATVGLRSASQLADTTLAINALGDQLKDISAENVISQLRSLSVASGMPLAQLAKFEQGFVSLGVSGSQSLQLIEQTLSALAATGNLTQASFQGVGRALQQIGSKPLLQLEELNQIADQIPAASRVKIIQQIAKDTGDSIAEVQERFRLGTQQSGDAMTAVVEVIRKLDHSGEALENRAKTVGGAFSILKANIQNSLADVFTPLGAQLAEEMNKIDVKGLTEKVAGPIANALQTMIPPLVAALPDIVEGLAFVFSKLAPLIASAATAAGNLARTFVENKDTIEGIFADLGNFVGGLIDTIIALAPAFDPLLVALGVSIKALGLFGEALSFLQPVFEIVGQVASYTFVPFIGSMKIVLATIEGLLSAISMIPESIPVFGSISKQAGEAANAVASVRGQLSALDGMNVQATISVASVSMTGGNKLPPGGQAFLDKINPAPPRIVIPNTGAGATAGGNAAADKAKAEAERLKKALLSSLEGLLDDLKRYAKDTGKQTVDAIKNNAERVVEGMRDAIEAANKAGNRSTAKALKEQMKRFQAANKNLVKLAKQRDVVVERLSEARGELDRLKDESKAFTDSVMDSVKAFGNITQDQGGIRTTFLGMRRELKSALGDTRRFTEAIKQLQAMGLNETSLRQIVEAGPEGGLDEAIALARSGSGGVAQINQLQKYLESAGMDLATGLNNQFYTAGIKAAEGLVRGLQSQEAALVRAMDSLADKLVSSIKKKLKIKSPSGVFEDEIGAMLPEGAARGIYKRMAVAERASAQLGNQTIINFGEAAVQVNGVKNPTEEGARYAGQTLADILAKRQTSAALSGTGG